MLALETTALRFPRLIDALIDDPHYDLIRNLTRNGRGLDSWPIHTRVVLPIETQTRQPDDCVVFALLI